MAVDLDALRDIAIGDPDAKVAVKRRWLQAALAEMEDLKRLRAEARMADRIADIAERLTGKHAA